MMPAMGNFQHPERRTRRRWRGLTQLQARRQFVATLVISSSLMLLALLSGTYLALRSQALTTEQARLTREAMMAAALLPAGVQTLADPASGAATLADRVSDMTGDDAALYQYAQQNLVAVSAHGLDVVGSPLPSAALLALVGACGPVAPTSCHHPYSGVVRAGDTEYEATYAPLFDANGRFVGAVMVATPLANALAGVHQTMLAFGALGLCLTLIVTAVGLYIFNRSTGQTLDILQSHLRTLAAAAVAMERAAHTTTLSSRRQERLARQISESARGMDTLVFTAHQGYPALQELAGAIWAEVSQPGAPADPLVVMRLARETALMATRVGAGMEDARVYCDHITRLMNHVVAQGRATALSGAETQRAARELRAAVDGMEELLGGRMITRDETFSPLPFSRPPERSLADTPARLPAQATGGSSGVWSASALFPSIPPLPVTERLPELHNARQVVTGEVKAITLEEPEARATPPQTPARFGDVSFPKLMKDASTRPLAETTETTEAVAVDNETAE